MTKKIYAALACSLFLTGVSHSILAKEICANCYWDTKCGSVAVSDIPSLGLVNNNPGVEPNDKGPFAQFSCDNGKAELGVLWTDKSCGETGGLSGLSPDKYPGIFDKAECEFGK